MYSFPDPSVTKYHKLVADKINIPTFLEASTSAREGLLERDRRGCFLCPTPTGISRSTEPNRVDAAPPTAASQPIPQPTRTPSGSPRSCACACAPLPKLRLRSPAREGPERRSPGGVAVGTGGGRGRRRRGVARGDWLAAVTGWWKELFQVASPCGAGTRRRGGRAWIPAYRGRGRSRRGGLPGKQVQVRRSPARPECGLVAECAGTGLPYGGPWCGAVLALEVNPVEWGRLPRFRSSAPSDWGWGPHPRLSRGVWAAPVT